MPSLRQATLLILLLLATAPIAWGEQITLDLSSLAHWKEVAFPWQSRHSVYTPVATEGGPGILIESDNSASSLEYDRVFATAATPILSWSWKATTVIPGGNAETKAGDDYAVRVSVMFPYDESRLSMVERMRYNIARELLGYYPASEIISYVWANRPHARSPIENAFSGRGMMFFLDAGSTHLGQWRTHTVNIVADYRAAYHRDPPPSFTLLIMGDSDNTHAKTRAYIRDLRVTDREPVATK